MSRPITCCHAFSMFFGIAYTPFTRPNGLPGNGFLCATGPFRIRHICPATHTFIFDGEPRISDHTVTYAIVTKAPGDLREALPFFSKQSLANAASELLNMGYQVRLKKIGVAPAEPLFAPRA